MNQNERRNLFTYATKELSQDAFLLWLFNNYDDEEVSPTSYALLRKFCGLAPDEKILSLETKAQWHKIDVSVWFSTDSGKKYALFVEDKTDSAEHNQLEEYNGHIDSSKKIREHNVCKIYYKPGKLYQDEMKRVEDAGWKYFEFGEICNLLKPFAGSSDPIVRMYIEHILAREEALSATEKPKNNDTPLDLLAWLSFFEKTAIPRMEKEFEGENVQFKTWRARHYPYIVLAAFYKGDECIPYLEIRSRNCIDGKFTAYILCYGMDITYALKGHQEKLIKRIEKSELFKCGKLCYSKKGKPIFPKQIGYTKEELLQAEDTDEFIEAVKKSVREFLDLMRDWD